ncbi:MAG: nitrite/sulfite reductase, partial [Pseudomonadota bacterium]
GLDYCSLANARSIPLAQRISERFDASGKTEKLGELKLKISGCINACGHHHVGHIGILGLDKAGVESYQITLGGEPADGPAIGDRTGPGFAYDEVPGAVETIVNRYIEVRESPDETFLQAYRRVGMTPFKEALYDAR